MAAQEPSTRLAVYSGECDLIGQRSSHTTLCDPEEVPPLSGSGSLGIGPVVGRRSHSRDGVLTPRICARCQVQEEFFGSCVGMS